MSRPFYVTTPIYYVNDVPHLGTAYTTIVADALRRYHGLRGRETFMLTGTDEHGLKLEREAVSRGLSPKAFVDDMSARFRAAWPKMSVEADHFIRTTDPEHERLVQEVWKRVEQNGDLYLGSYEDWYCVGCESFKTEKELLPGNECPLHPGRGAEKVREETYFFKLASYADRLLNYYDAHPSFIEPESRRNEVISFVKGGLHDLSVSRASFSWGIPVPGNDKHVMYVWFDALANYWTALGGFGSEGERKYWAPNAEVVHLVGKDILRFHTVYWPAFLMSAGMPLPSKVFAHGFLTIDGQKMSKSLRNAVDPVRLAETPELAGADGLRYQLLRAVAFGQDGDFDHAAMVERYNADLGKNLGNLLSRTLGLCSKLTAGKAPAFDPAALPADIDRAFVRDRLELAGQVPQYWESLAPHLALEHTLRLASRANKYVDEAAPWAAAKAGNQPAIDAALGLLLETLKTLSELLWPAMPTKANELRKQLGLGPLSATVGADAWTMHNTRIDPLAGGHALAPSGALFPTIDKEREAELLARLMPAPAAPAALAPAAGAVPGHPSAIPDSVAPAISYDDFAKIELKVGVVKSAEKVPKKDKLLKLTVDVGEPEPRTVIAGLALTFAPDALVGQRVIVVANLAPRDFGKGLVSHGMLLATGPSEKLVLATAPDSAEPGARLK
jgi:methionyl-tRNA synthetase